MLPKLGIFLCTFIGASTIVIAEPLVGEIPPILLLAIRFTAAAILLGVIAPRQIFPLTGRELAAGVLSGLGFGVGCALLYLALNHVNAGKLTFLIALEVVIVPILSFVLFRLRLSHLEKVALIPALVGLWLMTGDAEGGVSWWEVVGLLSAFAYSLYTIALSHLSSDIRVAARTFISFVVIGVVSFGVSWVWEPTTQVVWSRSGIIGLTYLVLVGSLGRFLIQAWAQRSVSASFTALTFTAEPVFAIALSFLFLGERFTPVQTIGATMIVIALVLANLRSAITSEPCV